MTRTDAPRTPQKAKAATDGTTRTHRTGPRAVEASESARKTGALILEALAGLRTTQEAADALGVALPRYYVLETRALAGFVAALEPRSRGRQRGASHRIAELEAEVQRLERETRRYQALQRASQRSLGLTPPGATAAAKLRSAAKAVALASGEQQKRKRGPRRRARGEQLARGLVRARQRVAPVSNAPASDALDDASTT